MPDTNPTHPYVITTAAIHREGKGAKASDLNWLLDFRNDEIAALKADHAEATRIYKHYTENLKAELAKRDEAIAETVEESVKLLKANCSKAQEIGSLRAQLHRAAAIEEPARKALAWLRSHGSGNYEVIRGLADALAPLASPSPGPVIDAAGSIDGNHTHGEFVAWAERLAKLERVAKRAKEYDAAMGGTESFQAYHLLRLALAELDALEVKS